MNDTWVLDCQNLTKEYQVGPEKLQVLKGVDLQVGQGELLAIVGSSGSGKTTLLNLLAGLDQPSAGKVLVDGQSLHDVPDKQRDRIRNRKMGFVFQFHHLLPEFTALENLLMPAWLGGDHSQKTNDLAIELMTKVGLAKRLQHKPSELSGGERQRVAIARALINQPELVLMDEPTGNLDDDTSGQIQQLIRELNEQLRVSFIVVTHSTELASTLEKTYRLAEGRLTQV